MSTIAFAHHKGGTGKTTSCLNIAGFLQKMGSRVLVVDCDPQANATSGLGIDPESREKNMYDVFMSFFEGFPDVSLADIIFPTDTGIELAPSSLDLVGVEPFLYNIDDRSRILKEAIEPVIEHYDHILIDTPPSMGQFVINGLVAADNTIVTLDAGIFALRGIDALTTIFDDIEENIGTRIIADMAILTRWSRVSRPPSTIDQIAEWLKKALNINDSGIGGDEDEERLNEFERQVKDLFASVLTVPFDSRVFEAQRRGIPLSHYAPESEAARVYQEIARKVYS